MTDDKIVQPDAVPAGTTLPAGEPPKPPEPSPEEKRIAEAVQKAVSEAMVKATETSKREIQSAKDKARAEVESALRRAKLAETTLHATDAQLKDVDPETAKEIELARFRAERQGRASLEQEELARQQIQQTYDNFYSGLGSYLNRLGIDPQDKRVDWGDQTKMSLVEIQQRVLNSAAEIQVEKAKALESSLDQKIKEAETRIKKELNPNQVDLNSVDTRMSGGTSGSGIPTDIKKLGAFVSGLTDAEYLKLKPDIDKMMAEGKIK